MKHLIRVTRGVQIGRTPRALVAGLATIFLLTGVVLASVRPADAATDAMGVVKDTVNSALPILRNKQIPVAQRRDDLKAIIARNFDFREMSRSALGYHWRQITPAQQQEFSRVFTTFIEDSYLAKINEFSNQSVQYLRERSDGPQFAQVETNLVSPGKDPLAINYRLLQKNGQWKIYDVTVDAISIIANYRNQFNRVMNNSGYATLIADLKSKQQALAASIGDRH